ncbi:MAG: hypothetical protein QOE90_545 [Thermoplasmata archaeon]|jgi:hypothetical protein|nr:hypothetical protein [Thermoplasmata archaeon]
MHMQTMDQLLARVAEHKGFTIQGADAEALFARKGDDTLLAAWKLDGPVSLPDAQLFLQACEQVHATHGILVAPKGVEPAAKDALAAAKGVEAWAESRLVLEVGEAMVHGAVVPGPSPSASPSPSLGPAAFPKEPSAFQATPAVQATNKSTAKFPSLVAQAASASVVSNAGAAYFMPNKHKEQPIDMQGGIAQGKGGSLGYAWGGAVGGTSNAGIAQVRSGRHPSRHVDQWGNLIPEGQEAPAAATPTRAATPVANAEEEAYEIITTPKKKAVAATEAPTNGSGVLKINVTAQDALAKSGKQGTPKLALYPNIAFDYDVRVERPELPAPIVGKGSVLISSLTGDLRTVDALAWEPAAPAEARKEAEKLQAVDIYDKIKGHMAKTFGKTLQVEKEIAGNTVMANLKIVPEPDECGLQHRGMILCPVWEITTSTGVTKVDAFTGAVF